MNRVTAALSLAILLALSAAPIKAAPIEDIVFDTRTAFHLLELEGIADSGDVARSRDAFDRGVNAIVTSTPASEHVARVTGLGRALVERCKVGDATSQPDAATEAVLMQYATEPVYLPVNEDAVQSQVAGLTRVVLDIVESFYAAQVNAEVLGVLNNLITGEFDFYYAEPLLPCLKAPLSEDDYHDLLGAISSDLPRWLAGEDLLEQLPKPVQIPDLPEAVAQKVREEYERFVAETIARRIFARVKPLYPLVCGLGAPTADAR